MIRNFKYILIALVLISNLWGQRELHGVWVDLEYVKPIKQSRELDPLGLLLIYGDVQIVGIYIYKENKQIVEDYTISCRNGRCVESTRNTKILIDAWTGDSYVENEVYNSVTGKTDKDYTYYTLLDDNTLLVDGVKYEKKFKTTGDVMKHAYKLLRNRR